MTAARLRDWTMLGLLALAPATGNAVTQPDTAPPLQGRSPEAQQGEVAPAPATGYMIDEAEMLRTDTVDALNALLHQHEVQTSNQVVVLTVPSLGGEDLESYSLRRASELKIGQRDRDNGVLLLIARDDRRLRIEVGYGLEGVLPDALCARIIREALVPRLQQGAPDEGVLEGTRLILAAIRGEYRARAVDRARSALGWLPAPPPLPANAQFIIGIFFWLASVIWFFLGPELFRVRGHPVRLGVLAGIPVCAYFLYHYPLFFLAPVVFGLLALAATAEAAYRRAQSRGQRLPAGAAVVGRLLFGDSGASAGGSSGGSSSSRSSSSGSGSSFSGRGGSFGGGGASGSW